jgi:restriction system protein
MATAPRTEIAYRLAWCRTYLKYVAALDNSSRGVWSVTEEGRPDRSRYGSNPARVHATRPSRDRRAGKDPEGAELEADNGSAQWRETLLETLVSLDPAAFERLCQRLLREAGFVSVEVTGRGGDGGIDGVGVLALSLLSFPMFFQAKRYKGNVGPGAVRDFGVRWLGAETKAFLSRRVCLAPRQDVRPAEMALRRSI